MTEQQLAAVKQALEALECIPTSGSMLGTYAEQKRIEAITTLQSIISQDALDKMAENAREPVAWTDLLKQAEEFVRSKSLWKKYIDGTPLANDIAVWMANFAQEHTTPPAAQQTCNCRWEGEVQVQQCTLHEAHVAAIHEWAERAKTAEAKLKTQPVPVKTYHDGKPWPVAPKPWVGLTDEERDELYAAHHDSCGYPITATGYEKAIEAKLKEKNT